ncbi:hypothetical protein JW859_11175 [bacterium]|nr:hypothetical protein [bacterium]
MADYQEKYDWYMNEVPNHHQATAEGRLESIRAEFNFLDPPPSGLLTDATCANYWANNYDDTVGPWPPHPQNQ